MQVTVVVGILDGLVAEFVRRSVDGAAFDAAAGEPGGVALGVVVATSGVLRPGTAAKLTGEDDEGALQKAALLEVFKQAGDGLVDGAAKGLVGLHVAVGIPTAVAAAGVTDLHEADAVFDETAGHEELAAEVVCRFVADAVEILDVLGFLREVDDAGGAELHAGGELVGFDAGSDVGVEGVAITEVAIEEGEGLHLLVALDGGAAGGWFEVGNGDGAGLEGGGREAGTEVAAGELDGRGGAADVDVGGEVFVAGAEGVRDPAAEGGIVEGATAVAGLGFDDGGKVIAFVAPHGADDCNVVDDAADVGEPVRDRDAGLTVILKGAQAGDDGALHLRNIVAEADGINELARVLVAFRIEGVNVADAAAHEEEDDCVGLFASGKMGVEFAVLCPESTDGAAEQCADGLLEDVAAGDFAAGIWS